MWGLIGAVALALLLLYVAFELWHTKTVDTVRPRRWRRTWTVEDQAEFDAIVRGDA